VFAKPSDTKTRPGEALSRHSNGLEQFFSYINNESGLSILDLGGVTQANVSFITGLGHRLYAEDFLRSLEQHFGDEPLPEPPHPTQIESFLAESLDYPESHFDGVLVWDVLEYAEAPVMTAVVERLHRVVKPASYLLTIFHSQDKADDGIHYSYRIQDAKTLLLSPRGHRRPLQQFNNRSLEKLFQAFESLKFFLTRDHLREVIVKR
jgi:Methyltransferase domain